MRLSSAPHAVFAAFAAAAAGLMLIFGVVGAPLTTLAAPQGILSYELAGTPAEAQAILDSWDARAQLIAAFTLGLDYLFMPVYSTALAIACAYAGKAMRTRGWRLGALAAGVALAQWLAPCFDAVENVALTAMLVNGVSLPWPAVSAAFATIKFALILAGLAYSTAGGAARLTRAWS